MLKKLFLTGLILTTLPVFAQQNGWVSLEQNAKKHLINLINIDTSQPDANELKAVRYIYKELNKNKIDWDIFIPSKPHANLIARIKGTQPANKPLLLISHLDTAPAASGWTYSPFKATEENGRIYGLGATDAKNYTAANLALFIWLDQQKTRPNRDIIFLVTSGEEIGSETGLLWLGGNHKDEIDAGFALNEGGGIIRDKNMPTIVFAEAATKMYMDVRITAKGTPSHSSIPLSNNAVYTLSQALAKIAAYNPPSRLTPTARTFFKAIYPVQTTDGQTTLTMLLEGNPENQQEAAEVMAQDPFFRSQLKDTFTPTELSAAMDTGTTTAQASALLNIRLLPGTDPDAFFETLTQLFADNENISLEIVERPQIPFAPAMDGHDPLFASIARTAQKLFPGAITVPGLSPASGDSEFLRKWGVITYGLGPNMNPLQENSAHSADEFISEQDFYQQLQFLAGTIFDFAYGKDLLPLTQPSLSDTIIIEENDYDEKN